MPKNLYLSILFSITLTRMFAQPVITSFSPATGPVGTVVSIVGLNFDATPGNNIVYFGAVKSTVTAATSTSLQVTVPAGATYNPVTVTVNGLTAYSAKPFTVTFPNSGHITPGSFAPKTDIGSGSGYYKFAVADLDGDGRSDVIASFPSSQVSVYRNTSYAGTISFSGSISNFAVRDGADAIATGDLDMDGKPDVAVSCGGNGSSGVSILRNISSPGIISLSNRMDLVSSIYSLCEGVIIYDFDGDGKPDIAVENGNNTMSVFRNTNTIAGTFSFASAQNYTIGSGFGNIAIGDLDGDGKRDIVVTKSSGSTVNLFMNTSTPGTISFAASTLTTASGPISACIDDFDHDGKNDLAVAVNGSHMVSVFKNKSTIGNINFESVSTNYTVNFSPTDIAVNDVDGDGQTDLVLSSSSLNPVFVLRHSNDFNAIAFETPVTYPGISGAGTARIADLDRDGTPDLLIGGNFAGAVSLFRNTVQQAQILSFNPIIGGPGTEVTIKGYNFTNTSDIKFGSTAVSTFTVISDSVILAKVGTGPAGAVHITTPYGNTTGSQFTYTNRPTINYFTPLYGDTNTIVTLSGSNFNTTPSSNIVYFGDVQATVLSATANKVNVKVPAGATYKPVTITTGGYTTYSVQPFTPIFKGAPNAFLATSFEDRKNFITGRGPVATYTCDLDGDGKSDVIVCNGTDNTVSVFRNISTTGAISLATKVDFATGSDPVTVVAADFNNDGKPDLAIGNLMANTVSVLRNTSTSGTISFAPRVDFSGPGSIGRLAVNDVDRDGLLDIVTANMNSNGNVTVLLNASSGSTISFANSGTFMVGSNPHSVVLHDIDYDGNVDMIVSSSSDNNIYVFKNNQSAFGSLSFTGPYPFSTGAGPYTGLEVNDLNNDSLADIVNVNYNGSSISVLQNTSLGTGITFNTALSYSTPVNPVNLTLGALDGDTKPDVAAVSASALSLFKNSSTATTCTMQPAVNYTAGSNADAVAISDLDNDGKPEVIVSNANNTISIYRNKINEATITPSGSSPVSGNIISRVTIDPSVQTHNGAPYVQRHYDIEPATNAATATATITLYFTQAEFDNYNAQPVHGTNLPVNSTDNANKANLRIYQYHGISASSMPGTYNGSSVEIDPDDNNIVWNATAQWWEVTFNVTGFSGFFAASAGNSILPLNLLSINGHAQNSHAIIEWVTSDEKHVNHFILQRSTNGRSFSEVVQLPAKNNSSVTTYQYADELGTESVYYYRVQVVDNDNSSLNSKVVMIKTDDSEAAISVSPNPVKGSARVLHPAATADARLLLVDVSGRAVRTVIPVPGSTQTFISTTGIAGGIYRVMFQTKSKSYSSTVMVK